MALKKLRKLTLVEDIFGFQCDCCKKEFTADSFENHIEISECYHGSARCGYGSVFGDGATITLTLCQHCFKEKLGAYIQVSKDQEQNA